MPVRKSSRNLLADIPDEEEEPISRVGRSHFTATGICCSSEIPMVKSILVPIEGVVEVKVSPATKAIYVDHDIDIVSASDLCRELDEGGFTATIIKDAAVEVTQMIGIPADVTVVSVFDVKVDDGKIGTTSLKDETVLASLKSSLGTEGIKMVKLSHRQDTIDVEYNPYYVTASQIRSSLDSVLEGYTLSIKKDGGADGRWALKEFEVEDSTIDLQKSSVSWPVILSGIFCAISFLW